MKDIHQRTIEKVVQLEQLVTELSKQMVNDRVYFVTCIKDLRDSLVIIENKIK